VYVSDFSTLEPRLRRRAQRLVMQQANSVPGLSAAMKSLPSGQSSLADTQALWRFLSNPRVTPADLSEPLLAMARKGIAESCDAFALAVHDWSRLNFGGHESKRDRVRMSHERDVGYELQSTVLVADREGSPINAPVQNLRTATGVLSSRTDPVRPDTPHLDELSQRMLWLERQELGRPLVHIVDREADSVGHLRQWSAQGSQWLVRVKAGSRVRYQDTTLKLDEVAAGLTFEQVREVECRGARAVQWIASTTVVLARAAQPKARAANGKRVAAVKGEPLRARLVVSQVRDDADKLLAEWYLLSNLPPTVDAATLGLWYYWRWNIESYFQLLKGAGQQVEHWEQESGQAIFKRLLIASQACALAWRLRREQGEWAERTRRFLVRLAGRQMKRSQPVTASALLAGMYMLFAMNETLEHYSPEEIARFAREALGMTPREREGDV
jgi:hypothetical protein